MTILYTAPLSIMPPVMPFTASKVPSSSLFSSAMAVSVVSPASSATIYCTEHHLDSPFRCHCQTESRPNMLPQSRYPYPTDPPCPWSRQWNIYGLPRSITVDCRNASIGSQGCSIAIESLQRSTQPRGLLPRPCILSSSPVQHPPRCRRYIPS